MFFKKTHTEELVEFLQENAPSPTPTQLVKQAYDAFETAELLTGVDYYLNKNDILLRQQYTYRDGIKVVDTEASNAKIPSGYHKILVDQKTAYLAGEPMTFGSRSGNDKNIQHLEDLIGEKWEDTLPELIKNASNKGKEWLHIFVNEAGLFDYMIIPAENLIPLYNKRTGNLDGAIRFYEDSADVIRLELWTDTDVTFYVLEGGEMMLDTTEEYNPAPHFIQGTQWKAWNRVPFIEFANNQERMGDIHFYKQMIDAYDLLVSDAQNTLEDMQSLVWALKGYTGEDLGDFLDNLKRYKAVSLDLEGGLDTIRAEVPVQAYEVQTEKLKENIFAFGQGVNPSPDIIGNAPSGVALTNLYSLLDMKASMLERKFTLALRQLMWFIQEYSITIGYQFDYRDITFTFNKMLLTNEAEIIQMVTASSGIISEETILENHPWVKDVSMEKERLERDKEAFEKALEPLEDPIDTEIEMSDM